MRRFDVFCCLRLVLWCFDGSCVVGLFDFGFLCVVMVCSSGFV